MKLCKIVAEEFFVWNLFDHYLDEDYFFCLKPYPDYVVNDQEYFKILKMYTEFSKDLEVVFNAELCDKLHITQYFEIGTNARANYILQFKDKTIARSICPFTFSGEEKFYINSFVGVLSDYGINNTNSDTFMKWLTKMEETIISLAEENEVVIYDPTQLKEVETNSEIHNQ